MLTPEEIAYIREWAASGNKPRGCFDLLSGSARYVALFCGHEIEILGAGGLTIAALAEENERLRQALRDACLIADEAVDEIAFEYPDRDNYYGPRLARLNELTEPLGL